MDPADKKKLKALANTLKPIVIIGQSGLTKPVLTEIERALNKHELIKIKIRAERETRQQISHEICAATDAELVRNIGQTAVIYRANPV